MDALLAMQISLAGYCIEQQKPTRWDHVIAHISSGVLGSPKTSKPDEITVRRERSKQCVSPYSGELEVEQELWAHRMGLIRFPAAHSRVPPCKLAAQRLRAKAELTRG